MTECERVCDDDQSCCHETSPVLRLGAVGGSIVPRYAKLLILLVPSLRSLWLPMLRHLLKYLPLQGKKDIDKFNGKSWNMKAQTSQTCKGSTCENALGVAQHHRHFNGTTTWNWHVLVETQLLYPIFCHLARSWYVSVTSQAAGRHRPSPGSPVSSPEWDAVEMRDATLQLSHLAFSPSCFSHQLIDMRHHMESTMERV